MTGVAESRGLAARVMVAVLLLLPGTTVAQDVYNPREALLGLPDSLFVDHDEPAVLKNGADVQWALARDYPTRLKIAGIDGRVLLFIHVDSAGDVDSVAVAAPSEHREFNSAAVRVARTMEFEPAKLDEAPVAIWIWQTIVFTVVAEVGCRGA